MLDSTAGPSRYLRAVTTHDDNDIGTVSSEGRVLTPRALWIGSKGNVVVIAEGDTSTVTISNVPEGSILPIRAKRVKSTSTTASNIVALY